MAVIRSELLLLCNIHAGDYTLSTHGGEWRGCYPGLRQALQAAATLIERETAVTLYNQEGQRLLSTTVFPKQVGGL